MHLASILLIFPSCQAILTICLLLVYFVSAAGCHCFDFYGVRVTSLSWLNPLTGHITGLFWCWRHRNELKEIFGTI